MEAVYEIKETEVTFIGVFKKWQDLLLWEIAIRQRGNEPFFIKTKKRKINAQKLYEDTMEELNREAKADPGKLINKEDD